MLLLFLPAVTVYHICTVIAIPQMGKRFVLSESPRDFSRLTPLMTAAQKGVTLSAYRCCYTSISSLDDDELTAAQYVIACGHLEVLRLLLPSTADPVTFDPLFITLPFMWSNTVGSSLLSDSAHQSVCDQSSAAVTPFPCAVKDRKLPTSLLS